MILLINKCLEFCLKIVGLGPFRCNLVTLLIISSITVTSLPFQCWQLLELSSYPELFVEVLGNISAQVLILIKFLCLRKNKKRIDQLLLQIYDEWSAKSLPDEWVRLSWYSRVFCILDASSYQITTLLYCLDSLITFSIGKKPIEERTLMLASKYPFNYQSSPVYESLVLMQYVQSSTLVLVDSLGKSLLVSFVIHVTVNINKLKYYVHNYSSSLSNYQINKVCGKQRLKQVVRQHIKILTLVRGVDRTYTEIVFFQILLSGILICMSAFLIMSRLQLNNAVLVIKFTLFILLQFSQCFTFCFIGQYLRNKGKLVTDMIYTTLWYKCDPNEVKTIAFILKNAQAPLEISGKIFVLSMESFTTILKTSVSYLSVLRAMYA